MARIGWGRCIYWFIFWQSKKINTQWRLYSVRFGMQTLLEVIVYQKTEDWMWRFGINTPPRQALVCGCSVGGQGASWVSAFPSSQTNVPTWRVYSPLRCANDLAPVLKMPTRQNPHSAGFWLQPIRPTAVSQHTHAQPAHQKKILGANSALD